MALPPIKIPIIGEDKTGRALRSAEKGIRGLGKTASSVFGALGVGVGVTAITRLTMDVIQAGSAITDQAIATRTGIEELQALQFAARDAGASESNLTNALVRVQKSAGDAANGLATYTRAFDALGINVQEFLTLPTERKFETLGRSVVNAKNDQTAYNAALDILGSRNAPRLIEVLKRLGNEGFDELAKSAKAAGQVMDEEFAKSLDAAADQLEQFRRYVTNFWAGIIVDFGRGLGVFEDTRGIEQLNIEIEKLQRKIDELGPTRIGFATDIIEKMDALIVRRNQLAAAADKEADATDNLNDSLRDNAAASAAVIQSAVDRIAALQRQLDDIGRAPAENIKVLRAEVEKLGQTLKAAGAAGDVQGGLKAREELIKKQIELTRLEQSEKRKSDSEREKLIASITGSATTGTLAGMAPTAPTSTSTLGQTVRDFDRLSAERTARLTASGAISGGGQDTQKETALQAIRNTFGEDKELSQEIIDLMLKFSTEIQNLKTQVENVR